MASSTHASPGLGFDVHPCAERDPLKHITAELKSENPMVYQIPGERCWLTSYFSLIFYFSLIETLSLILNDASSHSDVSWCFQKSLYKYSLENCHDFA